MLRKREIMAGLFVLVSTYPEVSYADYFKCVNACLDRTISCNRTCQNRYYPNDTKAAEECASACMVTGGKCVNGCDKYKEGLTNKK